MTVALVTGITGQDGMYLAELLIAKGYEVFGLIRGQSNPKADRVRRAIPEVRLIDGDLTDQSSLARALAIAKPSEVYNLGAISFVAHSWKQPMLTAQVTGVGALNVLEAIRTHELLTGASIKFYQASSSEMFGKVQEIPQRESTQLWPRSPYGSAKAFAHHTTVNYRESYDMFACSGILFNHESPRRGPEFVTRKVTQAVARIKLGLSDSLSLGNLDAQRDWGFAGDYVEAMWMMLQHDSPDDYVIATGTTHSVRDLVEMAFACVEIDDWQRYVSIDPEFMRPAEVDLMVGDSAKAHRVLGWKPRVQFSELVEMMVSHDLADQSRMIS